MQSPHEPGEPGEAAAVAESLWDLWRLWRRRSHPIRRGAVTPEQYLLLRRLERNGPMAVSALAAELGVTSATVTVGTRRLEAAGYVRRERQAADQRVVVVSLSETGAAATAAWQAERRRALVDLLSVLRPEDRREFGRILRLLLAAER